MPTPFPPGRPGPLGGVPPAAFTDLLRALEGLRNARALAAMLACLVVGVLLASVFSVVAGGAGIVAPLLAASTLFIAAAAGINAAGLMLWDQARGLPARPFADAVAGALAAVPRVVALAIVLGLVAAAVVVGVAIAYLVCRLPVIGPILFVAVFPLSVVVMGLALTGLALCLLLALPALWDGAPIVRAVAQTLAVARRRPLEALLLLGVVALLAGGVGAVASGVLFVGLVPSIGLAASVLGDDGFLAMFGVAGHGATDVAAAGSAAYAIAAGIGAALLWALVASLASLVGLLGVSLVYLRVTVGLEVGPVETALRDRFALVGRQAADLGQKARDAAVRARDQARPGGGTAAAGVAAGSASTTPNASTAPAPPTTTPLPPPAAGAAPRELPPGATRPAIGQAVVCPQCLSAVAATDAFCGTCGHRLR